MNEIRIQRLFSVLNCNLALVIFLALSHVQAAASTIPIPLSQTTPKQNIAEFLSVYRSDHKHFSLDDIRLQGDQLKWSNETASVPNYGLDKSDYWFKFSVSNDSENLAERYIEISYPLLDVVEVFGVMSGEVTFQYQMGHTRPFQARPIDHRNFVFPIRLEANENIEIYLRINSFHSMQVPITLWTEEAFWKNDGVNQLIQGAYYGALVVMILFSLLVFSVVKEFMHLLASGFLCCLMFFHMQLHGIAYSYLWSDAVNWNSISLAVTIPLTTILGFQFAQVFLGLKDYLPTANKILNIICIGCAVAIIFAMIIPYHLIIPLVTLFATSGSTVVFASSLMVWNKANQAQRVYIVASVIYVLGTVMLGLNKFALVPRTLLTEDLVFVGSMLMAVMMTYGLAARVTLLQREKFELIKSQIVASEREASAKQMADHAQQENQAKSDFLAAMSHEIRTPMIGVQGMVELLQETQLDDSQHRYTQVINSSSLALVNIINDILDFSKIQAGRMNIENISFNLDELLNESLAIFSLQAAHKELEIIHFSKQEVPNLVNGDPTRIKQIIINLVGNALKFTEKGGIYLGVELLEKTEDKTLLKFYVKDSGVGLKEDQIDKIFTAFSQAEISTAREYGGTGLGLNISKQLVKLMGGEIGVESAYQQGATFWFTIPFAIQYSEVCHKTTQSKGEGNRVQLCMNSFSLINAIQEYSPDNSYKVTLWKEDTVNFKALFAAESQVWIVDYQVAEQLLTINNIPSKIEFLVVIIQENQKIDQSRLNEIALKTELVSMPMTRDKYYAAMNNLFGKGPVKEKVKVIQETYFPYRVLVAEDNEVNQMVVRKLLSKLVKECVVVENGEKALEAVVRGETFDLVLMDCEMPLMNGLEATKRIRIWESENKVSPTPIIALTAHAMDEHKEKTRDAGMDDHISKPFSKARIVEVLDAVRVGSLHSQSSSRGTASNNF